jgi:hypothetical protein
MADSKVSALTAATSAGGSDLLYLVQSNTSKKITVANFLANAGNVTLTGNINLGGTPQTLSSPGIISLTTPITHLTVDAIGGTLQIPQGTTGQVKILTLIGASGGTYALNYSNVAGNANVIFDTVGDTAQMLFTNSKWFVIGGTANVTY